MKKIYLFCVLLMSGFTLKAQFFALEFDSVNPYVTALPYPMDENYRVLSYDHRFPAVPVNRARIKVYDSTQQYVKTIPLLKGITLLNDYPPLLYNKHLLWPANYNDTIEHTFNSLVILELDTNYNFIALHKLSSHLDKALPTGLVEYSKGFVVGEYFNGPAVSSTGFSTKVFKLGLNLQKKDSVLFLDELRLKTHTSKNDRIVGASDNLSPSCTPTIPVTQKIVLDTNLTIIDCLNMPVSSVYFCYDNAGNMILQYPVRFKPKGIIFPLSNYRNYVHGEVDTYNCPSLITSKAINNIVLKGNISSGGYLNANKPQDTEFPLYMAADFDYYGSNTIYVGTIGLKNNYLVDKNFYRPYYAKLKTKMSVVKLDTLGKNTWSNQFGGEMNYFGRSVAFTKDGGCVVAGSRYDSAAFYPNKVFQNFLMKLDANGNVVNVGVKENALSNRKINCFPNPATKNIYLDVPPEENITVQIYNSFGQMVLQKKNYIRLSNIDVEDLEKGIYIYKISSAKNLYSGKLLKE